MVDGMCVRDASDLLKNGDNGDKKFLDGSNHLKQILASTSDCGRTAMSYPVPVLGRSVARRGNYWKRQLVLLCVQLFFVL
jgi:hypothetical protein